MAALLQISDVYTNPNSTDAELFVNSGNGIGISGSYAGSLLALNGTPLANVQSIQDGNLITARATPARGPCQQRWPHPRSTASTRWMLPTAWPNSAAGLS